MSWTLLHAKYSMLLNSHLIALIGLSDASGIWHKQIITDCNRNSSTYNFHLDMHEMQTQA